MSKSSSKIRNQTKSPSLRRIRITSTRVTTVKVTKMNRMQIRKRGLTKARVNPAKIKSRRKAKLVRMNQAILNLRQDKDNPTAESSSTKN